jgi:hypothetical protein
LRPGVLHGDAGGRRRVRLPQGASVGTAWACR